jgi:hypothetical protein
MAISSGQTGFDITVDEMLPVCLMPEWLCVGPVLHGKVRVRGKELSCFRLGLLQTSKLR